MEKKNNPLSEMMQESMAKVREMVDTNTIVGQPIETSRVSIGFGGGGTAFGAKKAEPDDPKNLGTAIGAGVKIDPVAFLIVKDGFTRVMPVAAAPLSTIDRVVEMVPGVVDQVANFIDSRKKPEDPPVEEPC